ncbi:DNA repair protein RadC [Fulvivirga imtechensis AK7]|uniref:DNA repair protein RadC n=1 Tax=Fulvivirga imtechensis AK7 TaxID=1237149 RepID=L8JKX9_9BACT|nr:DNA repair protein RadC [Fulvivirga imtechensis]ELR69455.1 DNA repair protein RadC [Fulvivirga imtechensis AK7]
MKEVKEYLTIKSWAEEDRPREKLLLKGKSALSDAELIGILISSGTASMSAIDVAKQILNHTHNDLNQLAKLSVKDLIKFRGIGEAKAIAIVSAMELGRRRKETASAKKPKITCSEDAYQAIKPELLDIGHEEFWALLLNRSNTVMKKQLVSSGGVSGTVADPKIIFKSALEELACGIILVHNHPSGNLRPSEADINLTRKMKEAGRLLEIPVLDHIIFTDNSYFSFADENML